METEMGPCNFPEDSQYMNCSADIFPSWLDIDDIYTPTFPEELHHSHMLDDFYHFAESGLEPDPFSLIPAQEEYSNHSLLHDLYDFQPDAGDYHHPLQPEISVTAEPTAPSTAMMMEEDESDCFLSDDICLISPYESQESFFDHVLGLVSTPTTTNSSDFNLEMFETTNSGVPQEEEEEEEETDEDPKPGTLNCKNLFSERNRRKRLSQQLLALRALVPNITKMDKRSVLVDALAYLKSIQEETTRIQTELKISSKHNNKKTPDTLLPLRTLAPLQRTPSKHKALILEIDTEKIEDRRFVVKITCKGGAGVAGEVLRVIESLGVEITYTSLDQIKPMHVLTTVFIRVRKQGQMTEEKLKDCITSMALRSGLMLQNP